MQKTSLWVMLLLLASSTRAQTRIPVDSAASHIDDTVLVCAKVYGVKSLSNITFINLGAAYPHSPLTLVIFGRDMGNFKNSPESLYDQKQICVRGKVEEYRGKAEIIVHKPEEITVE